MSTSGILRAENVVFYHPLDDNTEFTQSDTWDGSGVFVPGKIINAISPIVSSDILLGPKVKCQAAEFNVIDAANPMRMTSLTDTLVMAAWAINVFPLGPDNGKCKAGIVSDLDINWGSAVLFNPDNDTGHGRHGDIIRLTDEKFAIGYSHIVSGVGLYIRVGTVTSGTTIVLGDEYSIASANPDGEYRICTIDDERIFMFYRDGATTRATARVATVSGTTVTFGDAVEYNTATEPTSNFSNRSLDCVGLTPSSVLCVSNDDGFGNGEELSKVAVLSGASGNVITFGSGVDPGPCVGIHLDVAKVDSERVILSKTGNNAGDASVGTISGVSGISWGADTEYAAGNIQQVSAESLGSGNILIFHRTTAADAATLLGTISGTVLNFGPSTDLPDGGIKHQLLNTQKLTTSKFMIGAVDFDPLSDDKGDVNSWIGVLDVEASMSGLTGSGTYLSASGATRVTYAMWSNRLTRDFTTITVERGYDLTMTKTIISLGGSTWNDAAITSLMSSMNTGVDRFLVLDFENTSGNNWLLNTSVDGVSWVSQGEQNTGSQPVITVDTNPRLDMGSGVGPAQWMDELVMWVGDKSVFTQFTDNELNKVYNLAATRDLTMDQYGTSIETSGSLFIAGPLDIAASGDFYIQGPILFSGSATLYTEGPFPYNDQANCYIAGQLSESGTSLRSINRLTRTGDHDPQLVNTFEVSASGVNIQVWDTIDGQNNLMAITSSGCYQIGDTDTWGWSTANLPVSSGTNKRQYYYRMLSNQNESQYGEFFLTVPEDAVFSYPSDQDTIIQSD
jgi:hypothetical protein